MSRPRVALCFPHLVPGGGGESPTLWAVEALKHDYEVTLIGEGRISLPKLNACYGTRIGPGEVRVVEIPMPGPFLCSFAAFRGAILNRYCLKHASEYDLMVSMYNVLDFGRKGIQFIADFSFHAPLREALHGLPAGRKRWLYKPSPFRTAYIAFNNLLGGTTFEGWRRNTTVSNSHWTRGVMKRTFGISSEVIYPPVLVDRPPRPWAEKEIGFVYLGRLSYEKRVEQIIDILSCVRTRHPEVHLHVVGGAHHSYLRSLEPLFRRHRDWIHYEGRKFMEEKVAIIDRHRYGISACAYEAFGIAVAEMTHVGNLVFVPDGCCQVEIVDHPDLIYRDRKDACAKIIRVLDSPEKQEALRRHVLSWNGRFSPRRFMREVRELVQRFFAENPPPSAD